MYVALALNFLLETTVGTFNPVAPLGVSLLAATVVVPSLALAVVVVGAVVVSPAAGFVVVSPVAAVVDSETSSTTNLMFLTSLPSPRLIFLTALWSSHLLSLLFSLDAVTVASEPILFVSCL